MSRLIDADALKEKAWDADTRCGYVQVVDVGDIDDAPTIEPEPHWIPVTERLPRLDESVLATTAWNDITIAWRTGINKWLIHEGNTNVEIDDLIAWMPLPEPYNAD